MPEPCPHGDTRVGHLATPACCVLACFPRVRVTSGCFGLRWLDQRPPAAATAAKTTQSVRLQQRQVCAQRQHTAQCQLRELQCPSQRPGDDAARECTPRQALRQQQAPAGGRRRCVAAPSCERLQRRQRNSDAQSGSKPALTRPFKATSGGEACGSGDDDSSVSRAAAAVS